MERCPVNKNRTERRRMIRFGKLKLLYDRFLEQYPTKLVISVQNNDVSISNIEQIKKWNGMRKKFLKKRIGFILKSEGFDRCILKNVLLYSLRSIRDCSALDAAI